MNAATRDPGFLAVDRGWTLACGERYWPCGAKRIAELPLAISPASPGSDPSLTMVSLPEWAADLGVSGSLLAFSSSIQTGGNLPEWQRCDWISTAYHMLACSVERAHEARYGPVLSYAFRLSARLAPVFDHAWVNRIFLFLRRWAAHEAGKNEEALFGKLPPHRFVITHDLDALRLTPEIRLKQGVFQTVNFARALADRQPASAVRRLSYAFRYLFARGDLHTLGRLRAMERAAGVQSILHVYGGPPGLRRGTAKRILMDPAYDVMAIADDLRQFREDGHIVGLHQSFDAWESAQPMRREKIRVEQALGNTVRHCRQHWLHFSFARTWAAQAEAGLLSDSTLGFNDRPGFRAGHALCISPHLPEEGIVLPLETVPMILMDSHVFDYAGPNGGSPEAFMKPWLDEVRAVRGVAAVNWHPHTIGQVYGWGGGFESLLGMLG
jgi:hypothetical protein